MLTKCRQVLTAVVVGLLEMLKTLASLSFSLAAW